MYIFISHSSKDAATAKELCNLLEANGSNCFLASRDIQPGQEYATEIMNAIDRSDTVLLLFSGHAQASPHVLREVERSVSKSVPIIVYKLEEVALTKSFEYFLMAHQWLDAECCRYDALLQCIRNLEKGSAADNTPAPTPVSGQAGRKNSKKIFALLIGLAIIISLSVALGIAISDSKKENPVSSDASTEQPKEPVALQPGDSVTLGSYNDAAIEWKVLKVSEDGTEALLVSKHILTFKAFDGADSGKYNVFDASTDSRGSNSWETSAIRTWLNSDRDYVVYEGAAPSDLAMTDNCNGYDLEAGFLYAFTDTELAAIKETTIETDHTTVSDKVFLLSKEDLTLFETAGVSLLSIPTQEAIARNESSFYAEYCQGVFKTDASVWWLRDSVEGSATDCYQVGHGATGTDTLFTSVVSADGYGIRPAITIDLTSDSLIQSQSKKN